MCAWTCRLGGATGSRAESRYSRALVDDDQAGAAPDLTTKAARGFLWALVGFVFVQLGSFATYTVASNILGAERTGLVGALLTVVFWIDVFLDTGLGASVVYEQEAGQSDRIKVAFTMTTAMTMVATSALRSSQASSGPATRPISSAWSPWLSRSRA